MGAVCGSSQICKSKENGAYSESNMQQKQKSLSDARDDVFEHDKRRHRLEDNKIASSPSSQSLTNSELMITPNPSANMLSGTSSRQSKSVIKFKQDKSKSDCNGEETAKGPKEPLDLPPKPPRMGHKSRVSRNMSASSISVSGISMSGTSHEEIVQPPMEQMKSRKSAKHCYVALDDEEIENENENENDNENGNTNSDRPKSVRSRKGTDENDGNNTPTPLSYKASKQNAMLDNPNNSNNKFIREKGTGNTERQRASSQDIMTAAEYALMEDSTTQKFGDFTGGGGVTPLATPSTNLHQSPFNKLQSHDMKSAKSNCSQSSIPSDAEDDTGLLSPKFYPHDFEDRTKPHHSSTKSLDSLSLNAGKMYRERGARRNAGGASLASGPMSNFNSTGSSSITNTFNKDGNGNIQPSQNQMIQDSHFSNNDNINVNNIYTITREPNLSMSAMQPSLLAQPNAPFPRVSSTSSDFAHLLEYGTRKDSRTKEDSSDYIQWRFSQSGINSKDVIAAQNIAGSSTSGGNFNSMSSIAIDRNHDL